MKIKYAIFLAWVICITTFLKVQAQVPMPLFAAVNKTPQLNISSGSLFTNSLSLPDTVHTDFINNPQSDYTPPWIQQDRHALNLSTISVSAIGIGYGLVALHKNAVRNLNYSTKNEIKEDDPSFHTHLDNYLQWSPAAAVMGLNLVGIHGERPFEDELSIYGVSTLLMLGAVESLKPLTHELRPDGSAYNSFPSGHTATAFAAAEWLRMEYWQRSPWIGMAGYSVATSVGVLRIYNNRHWVSDVVAGAAIGFLSTRVAYALNPWVERHIFHHHYK